jgi:hypothetical protein
MDYKPGEKAFSRSQGFLHQNAIHQFANVLARSLKRRDKVRLGGCPGRGLHANALQGNVTQLMHKVGECIF